MTINYCPTCGKELIEKDAEICPSCGVRISPSKKSGPQNQGSNIILWIAIAVVIVIVMLILSAVIAAFVFGMAGNVSKTRSIAVTAQKSLTGLITITNQGGPDIGDVSSFSIMVDSASPKNPLGILVGSTTTIQGTSGSKNHVIVTCTFKDGSQQVVLDTYI